MAMGNPPERKVLNFMWSYEKRLQYPVNIKTPNAKIAKLIISQYGGAYPRTLELFLPI